MNKNILFWMIGCIVLALFLAGCDQEEQLTEEELKEMFEGTEPSTVELSMCTTDSDCIAVDTSCCNCNYGGTKTVINQEYESYWNENYLANCEDVMCTAVISDDPSCFGIPKCIDNSCTLIYSVEETTPNSTEGIETDSETEEVSDPVEESQSVAEFTLQAVRWGYTPDTITVQKGSLVKITIKNLDATHGMKIPDLGIADDTYLEFVAEEVGTFMWYCNNYCGNGHSGMQGTLIVEE